MMVKAKAALEAEKRMQAEAAREAEKRNAGRPHSSEEPVIETRVVPDDTEEKLPSSPPQPE